MRRLAILGLLLVAAGPVLAADRPSWRRGPPARAEAAPTAWRRNMVRRFSPYAYYNWFADVPVEQPPPALGGWPQAQPTPWQRPSPPPPPAPGRWVRNYSVCEC